MFLLQPGVVRATSLRPIALLTAAATAGVGLSAAPAAATVDADTGAVTVDVLGFTDFHGRLEADLSVGGAAVLAGALDQFRAANADSVVVSSGDSVGASTFVSASQQDQPTLEALAAMGVEASAVGNHELDGGKDDFSGRIVPGSPFPYLAANISGLEGVAPHHVVTTASGVRVGFVGVTTESLPSLVSPDGMTGVSVTDPLAAATSQADVLSDGQEANGEADIVVVLAHEGPATTDAASLTGDAAYGELVTGLAAHGDVDAVLGGHTHLAYTHSLGDTFVAAQAGSYSEYLTQLSFTYDPATGEVTAARATNHALAPGGAPAFAPDLQVQSIVEAAAAQADVVGAEPVGRITGDVTRAVTAAGKENRGGESTLSNLVADVHLDATAELGTELALMNPGGVRADLTYAGVEGSATNTDGVVTYEEASLVQPFANSLMTFELTGAQLRAALEQQWQPEGASRPFLRLGVSRNFTSTYDPTAPAGQRITSMTLDGRPVTDTQVIKVVANSFLASGGDNFTALGEGTGHADAGRIDLDAFVSAMRTTQDAPLDPAALAAQRQVGVTVPVLRAGGSATVEVSSMLFSADPELGGTTVTLSLDGVPVGTADLDPTVTDGTDETGRASVTVAVPAATTAGAHTLTVSDGVTEVAVPVEIEAAAVTGPALSWAFPGSPTTQAWRMNFAPVDADQVFVGDWDGDGVDTPAYRVGTTLTVTNGTTDGAATRSFSYGRAGDRYVVGDFDGDGVDTFAVQRGTVFHVRQELAGGAADVRFPYGRPGDEPLVGDVDGDGTDTVSVRRGTVVHVNDRLAGGSARLTYAYGHATDAAHVADWDADGKDTVSVVRGDSLLVRNALAGGPAESVVGLGVTGDVLLPGTFEEGQGTSFVGVTRP